MAKTTTSKTKPPAETTVTSGNANPEGTARTGADKSTAVVESTASQSIATYDGGASVPSFMQKYAGQGTEAFGTEDVALPRLKLLQGLSPELEKYNSAKAGNLFHSGAEIVLQGPQRVVPIYSDLQYILWNPREAGGGILARAPDGVHWEPPDTEFRVRLDKKAGGHDVTWRTAKTVKQSGLNQWGSSNRNDSRSPPAATKMYNFLFAFPDLPDLPPAIFTFQRALLKRGSAFINKIRSMPAAPMWGTVFIIDSETDRGGGGDAFKTIAATAAGILTNASLFDHYTRLHELYMAEGFKSRDIESAQVADDDGDGGDDDGDGDAGGKPTY